MVLALVSCKAYQQLQLETETTHRIPFEYIKGLIVVEAKVQQQATKNRFIFDTAAHTSKIEYGLAERLQLPTTYKRSNGTAQGIRRTVEMTVIDSVFLQNLPFYRIAAGKLQYDAKSYSPCVAPDGIIGANLIKLANWKIDYQQQLLETSQSSLFPTENAKTHELDFKTSFRSGIPKIDIEIGGKRIKNVLFDVGYNGGLVVPEKYASLFSETASKLYIDQSTSGIFGSNRDTLIVKELSMKLGDFNTKIPVQFSSLNKALLGNDFLEHFTIFLNYDTKKIILQPKEKVQIAAERNFIPGILNDSLWIVNRTTPNSTLQIGDTLQTINGFRPKDIFRSHCDYFLQISTLLNQDSLLIKTQQQKIIHLNQSKK
jgi:predicted aspartyl protease